MLNHAGARLRWRVATVVLTVAALSLLGCTDGDGSAGRDGEGDAPSSTVEGLVPGGPWVYDPEMTYDLTFGMPSEASPAVEEYALASARHIEDEISRCMDDRGFDYLDVPDEVLQRSVASVHRDDDRATVAREGYGLVVERDDLPPEPEEPPSDAYVDALTGPGGCEGQARQLEREVDEVANAYSEDLLTVWESYQTHPDVLAAEYRWRSCMAASGYTFGDSTHAEDDLAREYALIPADPAAREEFRQREIAIALADFDCSERDADMLDQILSDLWAGFEADHRDDILRDLRALAPR